MFDDKKLWRDRVGRRVRDLGRYLRYIFNGHLVIVLLFLIGTAAFYYQKWIESLSTGFPAEMIISVFIGLSLTYSPVYNFLFEADKVFLIPLEDKLKGYFLRSGMVSIVFQGYLLLLLLAVLMPMYAKVSGNGFRSFLPFLGILLIIKIWNLTVSWKIHYFVQTSVHNSDMLVRFFINATFTYLMFKNATIIILLIIVLVMALYYRAFFIRTRKMGLKWDLLIDGEENRMDSFYRLANLFTDVPQLKATVKRRRWLDFILSGITFSQEKTYLYLFSRSFLRSSDYLGLFIRLTVIGSVAIFFISFGWGQILLCVLFLYLTGFQLLPLWSHHQNKLWVDLYPVAQKYKVTAFQLLLMSILIIQSVIFSLFIMIKGEWMIAFLALLSCLLFNLLFVFIYSKSRMKVS